MNYAAMLKFEDSEATETTNIINSWVPLHLGTVISEHKTARPLAWVNVTAFGEAIVTIQTIPNCAAADMVMRELRKYTAQVVDQFRGFFG